MEEKIGKGTEGACRVFVPYELGALTRAGCSNARVRQLCAREETQAHPRHYK
jgi:hypothetical protein